MSKASDPLIGPTYAGWCVDCGTIHALDRSAAAVREADALMNSLAADTRFGGDGKMMGVLVGEDRAGRPVVLRAFSGTIAGRADAEGFVGIPGRDPLTAASEVATLRELTRLSAEIELLDIAGAQHALASARQPYDTALSQLAADRRVRKRSRAQQRAGLASAAAEARADLDEESRLEGIAIRALRRDRAGAIGSLTEELERRLARHRELRNERRRRSRQLQAAMHAAQGFVNFAGRFAPLSQLYHPPRRIPSGTGDCCAPKLLEEAARRCVRPRGLAEFWWGPPPPDGSKQHRQFYGPCASKCKPLLGHLLCGAEAPRPPVAILYEDDFIIVADKPAGLLSVPGRRSSAQDCLQSRLAAMRPRDAFLRAVHRLDQATSGVLVLARDRATHRTLSAGFARAGVDKEYRAIVGGRVARSDGQIHLPLRPDLADRPRQVVDPIRGREARTLYRVDRRGDNRTALTLRPLTGRTHQLRVHCATGIGHPIVGDPLYGGAPADRLMLHAHRIELSHPATGARIAFASPAPF